MIKMIDTCRGCRSRAGFVQRLAMPPAPLAGSSYETAMDARLAKQYPLTWIECSRCALVQTLEDVPDSVLYTSYRYASSTVRGLDAHFDDLARTLFKAHGARVRFLEIGCNDGILLHRLPQTWSVIGVDPSDVAPQAASRGVEIVNRPFSLALAQELGAESVDVVSASNCLAHVSDIADVLEGVEHLLKPGGSLWVEVHDLEALLDAGQWDVIYHEHKAEWSVWALETCCALFGLRLQSCDRVPAQGGSLRCHFRKGVSAGLAAPRTAVDDAFARFGRTFDRRRETTLYKFVRYAQDKGAVVAAYGASARGCVWLNHVGLEFPYVVDGSPRRQNRWLPTLAFPVVSPEHFDNDPPDLCVVTAWNFAEMIKAQHLHRLSPNRWLQTFEVP